MISILLHGVELLKLSDIVPNRRCVGPAGLFYSPAVLRIRIEQMQMRMRIQEKISMRIRMRIHALTVLWRAKY